MFFLVLSSCGMGIANPNQGTQIVGASSAENPDGSVTVTITGSGFTNGSSVTVNGTLCTDVHVLSSTQLTCVLPSGLIALVNIIVTSPGGTVNVVVTSTGAGFFTVPAGVTSVQIQLWGAGGGGGSGDSGGSSAGGGAGGGGAYVSKIVSLTPGDTVSYTVGAGALGSSDQFGCTAASNGGASTIASLTLSAGGGSGGPSCDPYLGAGGIASGGTTNTNGSIGYAGVSSNDGAHGGAGANGGEGGVGGLQDASSGSNGNSPGGGGGGGGKRHYGGSGANGKITFTYTNP